MILVAYKIIPPATKEEFTEGDTVALEGALLHLLRVVGRAEFGVLYYFDTGEGVRLTCERLPKIEGVNP